MSPPPPSSAELETVALRTVDAAWKARDAEKLGSVYAPDARLVFGGFPDASGRGAIEDAARSFWSAFPDARYAWSREWRAAGLAIVESSWTGTNAGALRGSKATHKTAGGVALTLSWFTPDGLIREQHVYADAGSIATQLGLAPALGREKGRTFEGLPTSREEHAANGTVVERANLEIVEAAFLRRAQGDFKGFLSWLADDAEYVDFSRPGSQKGKGAMDRPHVHEVAAHVWGIEDYVIREYEDAEPKGPRVSSGAEVFQIRDGKLERGWGYANSLAAWPHAR